MANKANIANENVIVYLAEADTDPNNPNLWLEAGWCEGRQTKVTTPTTFYREMNGFVMTMGKELMFSATCLETDGAKISALDNLASKVIDILLISRANPLLKYLFQGYKLAISPNFKFSILDASRLNLQARRRVRTGSFGEVYSVSEILAMEGWAVVDVS